MSDQDQRSISGDMAEQLANRKTLAARAAVQAIPDGAVMGLGSGTTVDAMLHELAARVHQGLRVTGIPASQHTASPVPVEVTPFGWRHTSTRLAMLGCRPQLRTTAPATLPGEAGAQNSQAPYITDGGNYILDCYFGSISEPAALATAIKTTTGVVEHGLFLDMTNRVYVSADTGIQVYDRPS
jgi:ribose 5-phosphate isomerase